MSTDGRPYEVRVEPERLPGLRITVILVVGVVIIIASAVLVKEWLPRRLIVETTVHGAPDRIGNLEETLILAVHSTQRKEETKRRSLGEYGWVDREHGVAAIPIDQAMKLVVEQNR